MVKEFDTVTNRTKVFQYFRQKYEMSEARTLTQNYFEDNYTNIQKEEIEEIEGIIKPRNKSGKKTIQKEKVEFDKLIISGGRIYVS